MARPSASLSPDWTNPEPSALGLFLRETPAIEISQMSMKKQFFHLARCIAPKGIEVVWLEE